MIYGEAKNCWPYMYINPAVVIVNKNVATILQKEMHIRKKMPAKIRIYDKCI